MIEVPRREFDAQVMLWSIRLIRGMARGIGRTRALLDFEVALTRSMGLFSREHYLEQLDPAEVGTMGALRHYVLHGDARGLSPSPMFDVSHYDARCGERLGLNRLLHFGLVGCFRGLSPTPWFDVEHYLRSNPDVEPSPIAALVHFQRWGWREGRSPLPGLDMRRLLMRQPELSVVRGGALSALGRDWMRQQASRHRDSPPPAVAAESAATPLDLRDPLNWAGLTPRQWGQPAQVEVIIPVYGGLRETLHCLYSVLTAPVATPHRVRVINDAGPVSELNALLRSLASRGLFELVQHRSNLGFVRTVNHGLRLADRLDAVLLNSDTVVHNDWLDRLLAHAHAHARVATVTPLSNNATLCSYPETLSNNSLPLELDDAALDRLAAQVNAGRHVEAPTGVGFCMYVRRAALDDIGLLDERHFGRGYGEENDLCQRALQSGWVNAIACDVFVRHVGSVSFQGEAAKRSQAAQKTLARLHPDYAASVARHIGADPLWRFRARLDLARLVRLKRDRNVLMVSHNRGGGTERHVMEQVRQLENQGMGVFELRPSHAAGCVALVHPGLFGLQNVAAIPLADEAFLDEVVRELGLQAIHVHHLIDFAAAAPAALTALAQRQGLRLRLSIHDYYMLCPRVNLVTAEGRYCGEPDEAACDRCLAADGLNARTGSITSWRQSSRRWLEAAEHVLVPSQDVARRLAVLAPDVAFQVEPHEPDPAPMARDPRPRQSGQALRVLVVGAISRVKGYDVVLALAREIQQSGLPMELRLLGYSIDDGQLAGAGVRLLGRYFDHELVARIEAEDPDLVLVPSIWPETYCYVLSGVFAAGRPLAVFDLGAQADRCRDHDARHLLLPLRLADTPSELARVLLQLDVAKGGGAAAP